MSQVAETNKRWTWNTWLTWDQARKGKVADFLLRKEWIGEQVASMPDAGVGEVGASLALTVDGLTVRVADGIYVEVYTPAGVKAAAGRGAATVTAGGIYIVVSNGLRKKIRI